VRGRGGLEPGAVLAGRDAESSDEKPPHRFGAAKAGESCGLGNPVPRVEHGLGIIKPRALDELGWGNVEFGGKEPGEMARAHPRVGGQ